MPSTPTLNAKVKTAKMKISVTKTKVIAANMSDIADKPWTIQLTPIDDVMPRGYIQMTYFYKNTKGIKRGEYMQPRRLKHSLSEALRYFPVISGRLRELPDGGLEVQANNLGVQFSQAQADFSLAELEKHLESSLLPDGFTPSNVYGDFLLRVQVTYMKDNSAVLSLLVNHSVCDGPAAFTFLRAWSEIAGKRNEDLSYLDVSHDRNALYPDFKPSRYPHEEYKIYSPEEFENAAKMECPPTSMQSFHYTGAQLNRIRNSIDHVDCAVTNLNLLGAIVWRSIVRARNLPSTDFTTLGLAINGRSRMKPPLPKGYFGNATFYSLTRLTVEEVTTMALPNLAIHVHEAEDSVTDDYIRSAVNWIEATENKANVGPGISPCYSNDVAVSSWANIPVFDVDFGDGRPFGFKVSPQTVMDGIVMILPAREEGNVEVIVGLCEEHMKRLLEDDEFTKLSY